jgi:hypothetical protein
VPTGLPERLELVVALEPLEQLGHREMLAMMELPEPQGRQVEMVPPVPPAQVEERVLPGPQELVVILEPLGQLGLQR